MKANCRLAVQHVPLTALSLGSPVECVSAAERLAQQLGSGSIMLVASRPWWPPACRPCRAGFKTRTTCVHCVGGPRLIMTTDSQRGTVEFKLREPGFLRNYEVSEYVELQMSILGLRGEGL